MSILENLISKVKFRNKLNLDNIEENLFIKIASEYISALGGKENIQDIYSCSTRLRVVLKENKINTEQLINFGVKKIIKLDELNYQIIVGKKALKLEEVIKKYLN